MGEWEGILGKIEGGGEDERKKKLNKKKIKSWLLQVKLNLDPELSYGCPRSDHLNNTLGSLFHLP